MKRLSYANILHTAIWPYYQSRLIVSAALKSSVSETATLSSQYSLMCSNSLNFCEAHVRMVCMRRAYYTKQFIDCLWENAQDKNDWVIANIRYICILHNKTVNCVFTHVQLLRIKPRGRR